MPGPVCHEGVTPRFTPHCSCAVRRAAAANRIVAVIKIVRAIVDLMSISWYSPAPYTMGRAVRKWRGPARGKHHARGETARRMGLRGCQGLPQPSGIACVDTDLLLLTMSAFVPIPGGWFTMGTERGLEDERPPHRVYVDPFELSVCAVSRGDYQRF